VLHQVLALTVLPNVRLVALPVQLAHAERENILEVQPVSQEGRHVLSGFNGSATVDCARTARPPREPSHTHHSKLSQDSLLPAYQCRAVSMACASKRTPLYVQCTPNRLPAAFRRSRPPGADLGIYSRPRGEPGCTLVARWEEDHHPGVFRCSPSSGLNDDDGVAHCRPRSRIW
jgi:hypothetical protein